MQKLLETIYTKVRESHEYQSMEDLYYMSKESMKNDIALGVKYLKKLSVCIESVILKVKDDDLLSFYELHKSVLLLAAPHDFESYLLYVESNREPE